MSQRSLLGEQASFIHPSLRVASAPGASVSVFNSGPLSAENTPFNSKGPFLGERETETGRQAGVGGMGVG